MAFATHHDPQLATVTAANETATRNAVIAMLNRDTAEALSFYSDYFAFLMDIKPLEHRSDRDRFAFYLARPPIGADGLPPEDEDGVFPRWFQLAAQDQQYYGECVRDYVKLMEAALNEVADGEV